MSQYALDAPPCGLPGELWTREIIGRHLQGAYNETGMSHACSRLERWALLLTCHWFAKNARVGHSVFHRVMAESAAARGDWYLLMWAHRLVLIYPLHAERAAIRHGMLDLFWGMVGACPARVEVEWLNTAAYYGRHLSVLETLARVRGLTVATVKASTFSAFYTRTVVNAVAADQKDVFDWLMRRYDPSDPVTTLLYGDIVAAINDAALGRSRLYYFRALVAVLPKEDVRRLLYGAAWDEANFNILHERMIAFGDAQRTAVQSASIT